MNIDESMIRSGRKAGIVSCERKNIKTVEITMEKVIRVSKKFEVTDKEYAAIQSDGKCPRSDEMIEAIKQADERFYKTGEPCNDADVEYDYSIMDDDGCELVEWGWGPSGHGYYIDSRNAIEEFIQWNSTTKPELELEDDAPDGYECELLDIVSIS